MRGWVAVASGAAGDQGISSSSSTSKTSRSTRGAGAAASLPRDDEGYRLLETDEEEMRRAAGTGEGEGRPPVATSKDLDAMEAGLPGGAAATNGTGAGGHSDGTAATTLGGRLRAWWRRLDIRVMSEREVGVVWCGYAG